MSPRAVLVLVAVFSWLATVAITVTVLTVGPIARPNGGELTLIAQAEEDNTRAPLPRYGLVPVFDLTDQLGRPFGLNDLRGKVWVCDTIFTRCSAICPTLTGGMADIQDAVAMDDDLAGRVMLVSLSIDGGHDSPEVLKRFADGYGADYDRWRFLTGDRGVVWPLIQDGLKLPVEQAEPGADMQILHSGKLLLIDEAGVIRGYYDGLNDAGRIDLLVDLRRLLSEWRGADAR